LLLSQLTIPFFAGLFFPGSTILVCTCFCFCFGSSLPLV
jgi:hypothetical protein